MRVRSQKLIHWSEKHTKKRRLLKSLLKGPASNQEFLKCATTIQEIPKWASSNQEFLKCATTNWEFPKCASSNQVTHFRNSWIELAHFGNSQFVVAQFRNSWIELAHFGNSWFEVAHFRNSWFEAGPFETVFRKLRFLVCFPLQWISFLASYSHLFKWHWYSAKKWSKTPISARKRSSNILLPHIWSHHRLLCPMTKLKKTQ